ncbi:hypothetical protein TRVA0_023S01398 [Trichomonascus vanleenenianus]|uniref:uncharacterized protein n=1 Tax=Trichomonascus vanleenenianus TaxID=2268995 RepID=UPI003EC9A06E
MDLTADILLIIFQYLSEGRYCEDSWLWIVRPVCKQFDRVATSLIWRELCYFINSEPLPAEDVIRVSGRAELVGFVRGELDYLETIIEQDMDLQCWWDEFCINVRTIPFENRFNMWHNAEKARMCIQNYDRSIPSNPLAEKVMARLSYWREPDKYAALVDAIADELSKEYTGYAGWPYFSNVINAKTVSAGADVVARHCSNILHLQVTSGVKDGCYDLDQYNLYLETLSAIAANAVLDMLEIRFALDSGQNGSIGLAMDVLSLFAGTSMDRLKLDITFDNLVEGNLNAVLGQVTAIKSNPLLKISLTKNHGPNTTILSEPLDLSNLEELALCFSSIFSRWFLGTQSLCQNLKRLELNLDGLFNDQLRHLELSKGIQDLTLTCDDHVGPGSICGRGVNFLTIKGISAMCGFFSIECRNATVLTVKGCGQLGSSSTIGLILFKDLQHMYCNGLSMALLTELINKYRPLRSIRITNHKSILHQSSGATVQYLSALWKSRYLPPRLEIDTDLRVDATPKLQIIQKFLCHPSVQKLLIGTRIHYGVYMENFSLLRKYTGCIGRDSSNPNMFWYEVNPQLRSANIIENELVRAYFI